MICDAILLEREGWKEGGRKRTISITVIIDITTIIKLPRFPSCTIPLPSQLVDLF